MHTRSRAYPRTPLLHKKAALGLSWPRASPCPHLHSVCALLSVYGLRILGLGAPAWVSSSRTGHWFFSMFSRNVSILVSPG